MGWNAYATKNGEILSISELSEAVWILSDHELRLAFHEAAEATLSQTRKVDGTLRMGSLNCITCGQAIDRYGGFDPWSREGLTPEQVCVVVRNWTPPQNETWETLSAYLFLKTCRDYALGVYFTW